MAAAQRQAGEGVISLPEYFEIVKSAGFADADKVSAVRMPGTSLVIRVMERGFC